MLRECAEHRVQTLIGIGRVLADSVQIKMDGDMFNDHLLGKDCAFNAKYAP